MSEKIQVSGINMDLMTREEFSSGMTAIMTDDRLSTLTFADKKTVDITQDDKEYTDILNRFSLVIPYDKNTAGEMNILNFNAMPVLGENMSSLFRNEKAGKKYSVYIITDSRKKIRSVRSFLEKSRIRPEYRGYFIRTADSDDQKAVNEINACIPDITVVSMEAPEQEYWIFEHAEMLNTKLCMGAGVLTETGSGKRAGILQRIHFRK